METALVLISGHAAESIILYNKAKIETGGVPVVRRWNQLTYQSKLFLSFLMLGIIPSIVIGTMAYLKSVDTLERRVSEDLRVIAGQLNEAIQRQVEDVDRFSTFPYFTPEILEILGEPYMPREQWSYREIETQRQFAKLLVTYPSISTTIQGILFFSDKGNVYGYRVSDRSSINETVSPVEEPWYRETQERGGGIAISGLRMERQFNSPPFNTITASRVLLNDDFSTAGVIAIDINPDFIQNIVRSFQLETMHVLVADEKGELIYSTQGTDNRQFLDAAAAQAEKLGATKGMITVPELSESHPAATGVYAYSDYLGWTTYLLIDRQELLGDVNVIRNFTIILVAVFTVLAAILSLLLARGLSKPIRRLISSMREVELGVFAPPTEPLAKGELGQLHLSYVTMVRRLDMLIQSIEEKERQKREAELYALRARIAPHFLYNTINSIRMLAVLQQSDAIAKLLLSLGKLLHANMKLDSELVPLSAELELLHHYVRLMELRYTNRFQVEWQIQEGTPDALVLPMILQPLMENAIFHGSLNKDGVLQIEVGATLVGDGTELVIWIEDNGQGIEAGRVAELNAETPKAALQERASIGMANVRDRIQLRFGLPYTLKVESEQGAGTRVTVNVPYQSPSGLDS
ncbi:cache domain-containing sensor histidine kinase [Paenibacillus senegalimassiliensis]|uniref:cache domain-containing sensor histidine kinase n=1 Tax=Paenibacillus senegalimassiliensis TaxID=1737426 RepID=UPI001E49CBB5|nr:sensor histidine kinase [Paenibacillus senegalimassiliensis]